MGERSGEKIFHILTHHDFQLGIPGILFNGLPIAHIFKQQTAGKEGLGFQVLKDNGIDDLACQMVFYFREQIHTDQKNISTFFSDQDI